MNCFPELTYSLYVDNELPAQEARLVEVHLFMCPQCRALVHSLRVENRVLRDILLNLEPAGAAAPQRARLDPLWKFGGMCAALACFVTGADWLLKQFPGTADWVNPLNRTTLLNLLWTVALYFANEGANMLHLLVSTLGMLILGLLIAGAAYLLLRRRTVSVGLLASLTLVLGLAQPASAIETRRGTKVDVPSNETVDDTLIVASDALSIEGVVNGDVITSSRRVVITGTVKGDLVDFSRALDLDGNVEGNVYLVAQTANLRGTMARSLYGWAQTLELERGGRVNSDMVAGAAVLNFSGSGGRDVTVFAGTAGIRGEISRNLVAASGNITLSPTARVGGDLTAHVDKKEQVQIDPGATVRGKTEIKIKPPKSSPYTRPKFYFWQGVQLVAALLTGLVLFWLFPLVLGARMGSAGATMRAAGIGFLVLIATPIAAIVLGVTLIGLPVALLGLVAWLTGLYLAKIFVAALVGQTLMTSPTSRPGSFALALLLGLVLVFVAVNLPYLGGWIRALVVLLGLGIGFVQVRAYWQVTRRATTPVPVGQ